MLTHTKTKLPYLRQLLIQDSIQLKTLPVPNPFFSSIWLLGIRGLRLASCSPRIQELSVIQYMLCFSFLYTFCKHKHQFKNRSSGLSFACLFHIHYINTNIQYLIQSQMVFHMNIRSLQNTLRVLRERQAFHRQILQKKLGV